MENYKVNATFPIQVGRGRIDKPKGNDTIGIERPKKRNDKLGFLETPLYKNKVGTKTKGIGRDD